MALTKTDIALIKEALANPSSPGALRRLLLERYAPPSADDPLTVTNSVVLHLAARLAYLEMRLTRLLVELEAPEEKAPSGDAALPAGATVTHDEEGEVVVVNNAHVVAGAAQPVSPGGAVDSVARAPDATPFPAGVAASAPPGTSPRTTVVASAASAASAASTSTSASASAGKAKK